MSESKFIISYNFTTVRGDTYEEFVHNCVQAFGEGLGQAVAVNAMAELASHFAGSAVAAQATQTVVNTLGAVETQYVPQQAAQPQQQAFQAVPQPGFSPQPTQHGFVFLNIPFAQKDHAKSSGARWDKDRKAWYVPAGHPLTQQFSAL